MSNPVYKKEITITQVARSVIRDGKYYWRLPCSDASGVTDSLSIDNIEPTQEDEYLFVSNEDSTYSKFKIGRDVLESEYTLQADKLPTPIVEIPDTMDIGAKLSLQVSNVKAIADYVWSASAGEFNSTSGSEVEYTSPVENTPCMVKLSCYARPRQGAEIYSNSDTFEKYVYVYRNTSTDISVKPETDIEDFTVKSGETQEITVTNKGDYVILASSNNGTVQVSDNKVIYTGGEHEVPTKLYIFFKSSTGHGYSSPETVKILNIGVQENILESPTFTSESIDPLYSEEEVDIQFNKVEGKNYIATVSDQVPTGYVMDNIVHVKAPKVTQESQFTIELRAVEYKTGLISKPATLTIDVKPGVRPPLEETEGEEEKEEESGDTGAVTLPAGRSSKK